MKRGGGGGSIGSGIIGGNNGGNSGMIASVPGVLAKSACPPVVIGFV